METTDSDDATDQADKKKTIRPNKSKQNENNSNHQTDKEKTTTKTKFFWQKLQLSRNSRQKDHKINRQTKSQTKTLKSYTSQKAVKSTMDLGWNKSWNVIIFVSVCLSFKLFFSFLFSFFLSFICKLHYTVISLRNELNSFFLALLFIIFFSQISGDSSLGEGALLTCEHSDARSNILSHKFHAFNAWN